MRSILALSVVAVVGCGEPTDGDGSASSRTWRSGRAAEYLAPWACRARHWVTQGNDGDTCGGAAGEHHGIQAHAWDFALPRGSEVHASRAGTVSLVALPTAPGDDCFDGSGGAGDLQACCKRCRLLANRVNLDHGDGTVGAYWHLDRAAVTAGSRVQAGDVLGWSGTSGCSTGPHLHFQVMGACPGDFCQSKAIGFAEAARPVCGDLLQSRNCP